MSDEFLSDYGVVGDKISWVSAAGVLNGVIKSIDRNRKTANPSKLADYYMIDVVERQSSYLNSNMMKQLKVINLSAK